jgi:hypothetical protein
LPLDLVVTAEGHMRGIRLPVRRQQHVAQSHARPLGAADRLGAPRQLAGYRLDRHQLVAAVAGALQRRRQGHARKALDKLIQAQTQWPAHHSADQQVVASGIDLGNRAVVADEEEVGWGSRCLEQQLGRWPAVERLARADDERGMFAGWRQRLMLHCTLLPATTIGAASRICGAMRL